MTRTYRIIARHAYDTQVPWRTLYACDALELERMLAELTDAGFKCQVREYA